MIIVPLGGRARACEGYTSMGVSALLRADLDESLYRLSPEPEPPPISFAAAFDRREDNNLSWISACILRARDAALYSSMMMLQQSIH